MRTFSPQKTILALGICAIFALIAARVFLATQFDVFFVDEVTRGGLVKNLLNGNGFLPDTEHFSIFFVKTDADFSPITFFAPATLWAWFFGCSILSLRLFVCLVTIGGILLLADALSSWYKDKAGVLILTAIAGLTLPWNFLQGMIFWNPTLAPIYIILAFWAFSRLANPTGKNNKSAQAGRITAFLMLPLALIASAYNYKPVGYLAIGCYAVFYAYLIYNKLLTKRQVIFTLLLSCVVSMPLAIAYLTYPALTQRMSYLSLFSLQKAQWLSAFGENWRGLLSLEFLFGMGDPNRRHSIGFGGMIGAGAIIPVLSLIYFAAKKMLYKKELFLALISLMGIGLGMLGAALTVEGMPHSLRSCGAWVFFVILISLGLIKLYQNRQKLIIKSLLVLALSVITIITIMYVHIYESQFLPVADNYFNYSPEDLKGFPFISIFEQ